MLNVGVVLMVAPALARSFAKYFSYGSPVSVSPPHSNVVTHEAHMKRTNRRSTASGSTPLLQGKHGVKQAFHAKYPNTPLTLLLP